MWINCAGGEMSGHKCEFNKNREVEPGRGQVCIAVCSCCRNLGGSYLFGLKKLGEKCVRQNNAGV